MPSPRPASSDFTEVARKKSGDLVGTAAAWVVMLTMASAPSGNPGSRSKRSRTLSSIVMPPRWSKSNSASAKKP